MLAGSLLYLELNIYYYIISGVGIIPTPELLPMEETWKGTFLKKTHPPHALDGTNCCHVSIYILVRGFKASVLPGAGPVWR